MKKILFLFLLTAALCSKSEAQEFASRSEIRLHALICNNMVMQRNERVPVWGWGTPKEKIRVTTSWDGKSVYAWVDSLSRWKAEVDTPEAGGPYTITVSGRYDVIISNVMIGDVWFCSGQSNMEWSAMSAGGKGIPNRAEELEKAERYPALRLFAVQKNAAETPQENCNGAWSISGGAAAQWFSSVAQFFGQTLNDELKIPIGLIGSYWGGTAAEVWTPAETVEGDPLLREDSKVHRQDPRWFYPIAPGTAYNGMVHPVTPFPVAGAIWYQGESNCKVYENYDRLLTALIGDWRKAWNREFPFYIVQLSPYPDNDKKPGANIGLRHNQDRVSRQVPDCGMVVISDVGNAKDIHPRDKRPVGERLAYTALADHYRLPQFEAKKCPRYEDLTVKGRKAVVTFSATGGALRTADGTAPRYFELAGEDLRFHPAQAKIDGDRIILESEQVKKPYAVRYAWGSLVFGDILNKNGMPLGAFSSNLP